MTLRLLCACAAFALLPAGGTAVAATPTPKEVQPKSKEAKEAVDPAVLMAGMMKVFDRFFPAGPEPDPVRLAAARQATMTMFPKGAYAAGIGNFMDGMVERVLDMSQAEFQELGPPAKRKKGEKPKVPSKLPLRAELTKKDPNFDAKLAAGKAFARVMLGKFGDVAEPRFREGMSRLLARKFDDRQLGEIQTFLATPTGTAYGREMVGLWFDPEVMRGAFQAFPEIMALMPELMKEAEAFDQVMKEKGRAGAGTK